MRKTIGVLCSILLAGTAAAQDAPWRPTVMSLNGMVASGHPLASEAGIRILREGGNAIDAAIAAWLVQGQVEPGMTGIGGDMFILIYLAKTNEVKFINGTGPAPMAATAEFYRSRGGMPRDGALSVIVPGALGGALLALEKYGSLPRDRVMAPAIELAERGFPISDELARQLRSARERLAKFPSTTKVWFRNGEPLGAGDILVNRDLARTLRQIASGGADAFYRGPIAQRSVAFIRQHGGIHTEADWANYRAHEDQPISVTYRGIEVYECPPNSQGHVMLQALKILEGFNLKYMGHNSAPYLHLVTEALKLAFADRNAYVSDPRFVPPIPMRELLSEEYAAVRRALIDPRRAIEGEPPPGDPLKLTTKTPAYSRPQPNPGDVEDWDEATALALTTYLAVVDRDRNMVSITSSLLSGFGSGMVVEGAGFFLNNRMAYFSLDPGNVNVLAPGKRTRHTINPALALKDGKPYLVFGTPGADTQPQTQLQFFLNVVEFGMGIQQALEQPAVISTSFRSSYYPQEIGGTLLTPAALPVHVREELASLGHKLDVRNLRGVGRVKAIMVHPVTGALLGGVSPVGDSYVIGW
ncbi:MAG: gamma-glutamyltransferase [Gemmatimonadales bacterium]|nr:Gamma-glutamyltranspeptidase [bacterium HR33]GIW53266.1 MAG: gamma-glutamyltransferase [Gemmatimonadales bacterium]